MIGLQALRVALDGGAVTVDPVLFRLPGLPAAQQELYAAAAGFATVRALPWTDETPGRPFAGAASFARVIDLRDFAFDPAFRGVAMIDFFLGRLGVDAATVDAKSKRNTWLAAAVRPQPPAQAAGYVLLCPRASMELRVMPPAIIQAITAWLAGHSGRPLVVQHDVTSLAALCGQVAAASLVVSTDSAPVHLADAFAVPCLAFFPTHHPAWRVRDYPRCHAVRLHARGLEPAQEFARGPADLAAARAAWFPQGADMRWLHVALSRALDVAERRN